MTVSGESPLVENTTSDIGVTISEAQLENQPLNGRIYTQFVQQLPGAVGDGWSTASEAAAGAGARTAITADVNGMNFEGTMFTLDGLYNMEPLNAFVNITPPIDALEEMSIKTRTHLINILQSKFCETVVAQGVSADCDGRPLGTDRRTVGIDRADLAPGTA